MTLSTSRSAPPTKVLSQAAKDSRRSPRNVGGRPAPPHGRHRQAGPLVRQRRAAVCDPHPPAPATAGPVSPPPPTNRPPRPPQPRSEHQQHQRSPRPAERTAATARREAGDTLADSPPPALTSNNTWPTPCSSRTRTSREQLPPSSKNSDAGTPATPANGAHRRRRRHLRRPAHPAQELTHRLATTYNGRAEQLADRIAHPRPVRRPTEAAAACAATVTTTATTSPSSATALRRAGGARGTPPGRPRPPPARRTNFTTIDGDRPLA